MRCTPGVNPITLVHNPASVRKLDRATGQMYDEQARCGDTLAIVLNEPNSNTAQWEIRVFAKTSEVPSQIAHFVTDPIPHAPCRTVAIISHPGCQGWSISIQGTTATEQPVDVYLETSPDGNAIGPPINLFEATALGSA